MADFLAGHVSDGHISLLVQRNMEKKHTKENRMVFFGSFPFCLKLSAPDRRLDSLPTGGRSLAAERCGCNS
ncbi:MAG: hypothetical protein MJ118_03810 [Clostridia bacterium]|nr:hypothetical protein [Clostridia bacterium]